MRGVWAVLAGLATANALIFVFGIVGMYLIAAITPNPKPLVVPLVIIVFVIAGAGGWFVAQWLLRLRST
jgi:hypothetical protein